jgi:hypothetical protein
MTQEQPVIEDIAEAMRISPATVKRGWSVALARLHRDLKRYPALGSGSSAGSTGMDAADER